MTVMVIMTQKMMILTLALGRHANPKQRDRTGMSIFGDAWLFVCLFVYMHLYLSLRSYK